MSRGAASRNCRRFKEVDVVLPNTCRKPKFGTTKRGGCYEHVEKANITRHFRWYLKNLKLSPIKLCERYIESYPNDKGRSARDVAILSCQG